MEAILRAAGVAADALHDIRRVVQGCLICRDWHRPGPHNVAAYKLSLAFNEDVQFDLLFYTSVLWPERGQLVIVHLVDTCVRYDVAVVVPNKTEDILCAAITIRWISLFGPMTKLTLDEETGMRGQACQDWAATHGIELRFKAPRQKAWLVERHNELLRHALHTTELQLQKESLKVPFEEVLAVTLFAKNALTVINNATPFQALFGRQPTMLPPIEEGSLGSVSDQRPTAGSLSRHFQRVREVAAINIIDANALARVKRADKSKTRPATELAEWKQGQTVDIWFDPKDKDTPGWRGPSVISSVNAGEGNISVRYQGRTLDRQTSEVREHIPYFVFLVQCSDKSNHFQIWIFLQLAAESLQKGSGLTLGLVLDVGERSPGWKTTRATASKDGKHLYQLALRFASQVLHLSHCTTIRLLAGQTSAGCLPGFDACEVWYWHSSLHGGSLAEVPYVFTSDGDDCQTPCNFKSLCPPNSNPQHFCAIQFWCLGSETEVPTVSTNPQPSKRQINSDLGKGKRSNTNVPDESMDQRPPPPPPRPPFRPSGVLPPPPGLPPKSPTPLLPFLDRDDAPMNDATNIPIPASSTSSSSSPSTPGTHSRSRTPYSERSLNRTPMSQTSGNRSEKHDTAVGPRTPTHPCAPASPAVSSVSVSSVRSRSRTHGSPHSSAHTPSADSDATIWYPETIPDSGGAMSSHQPLLPLLQAPPVIEISSDSSDADSDEAFICSWRQQLEECDDDEGAPITDEESITDLVCEMAYHTEGPIQIDADSVRICESISVPSLYCQPEHVEIGLEGACAASHCAASHGLQSNESIVTLLTQTSQKSVIVKEFDVLSPEDLKTHAIEVAKAKLGELRDLHLLGCYERMPRRLAKNIVDTRWVIRWKLVDSIRTVKVRITMRGFKDSCMSLETFAGTATRWSQRVINSAAVTNEGFELFSFDVSKAFAKGMSFEELARLTGEPLRQVQFEVAPGDVAVIRKIPGFESFDPNTEVLAMIKSIYGLKDAPRAWRKKLHEVLSAFGMLASKADPQVYMLHSGTTPPQLQCILTTHVDDLKGAATKDVAQRLLAHLESAVGKCTQEWKAFTHTGIEHIQEADGVRAHQNTYVSQLQQIDIADIKGEDDETTVSDRFHSQYMSLLGGIAWMVLTRVDLAVFVQALQRRAHAPRVCDLKRLNTVVRYAKRRPLSIFYAKMPSKTVYHLCCITDAAFKAQPEDGSGLALKGCCILLRPSEDGALSSSGVSHLIEYQCRRQRRVVRSTFSAELNSLLDGLESAMTIQIIFHELEFGCSTMPGSLARMQEEGQLVPPLIAATDARAVFDAVAAAEICAPAESSLALHLLSIRDRITRGVLKYLYWFDTRDMLSDGLTKGSIDREALRQVAEKSSWKPIHPTMRTPKL